VTGSAEWLVVLFGTVAGIGIAYWLLYPWAMLVHELGHAATALALTDGRSTVQIGVDPDRSVTVGRLTVRVDPYAWRQRWYGYCHYETTPDGRYERAAMSLAGPAASLVVLAVTLAALAHAERMAFYTLFGLAFLVAAQVVTTVVPTTYSEEWGGPYGGTDSDGRRALRALRGLR
jgi:hypothetical protein